MVNVDETDQERWDIYWFTRYPPPNAIQIPTYNGYSSTGKFNCHGYAWLRVEQGIDRWIEKYLNGSNLGAFVRDGSYVEVPSETFPGKVFWTSDDHSAITTEEPGWVISKWANGPLCKHRWNYSPYGSSPTLKDYVKNCEGDFVSPPTDFIDQTVTTDQTVTGCSINVQNVIVTNNAKLKLGTLGEVRIEGTFKVQLGSELKVK